MSDRSVDGRLLQGLVKSLGPPALVTSWLYYIGWVRTNRRAGYFGIDPSLLGYSTTDYVLRSVTSLFGPVSALLIGLVLAGAVRRRVDRRLAADPEHSDRYQKLGHNVAVGGTALAVIGASLLPWVDSDGWWPLLSALTLIPGGMSLLLGRYLSASSESEGGTGLRIDGVEALIIGLILTVGMFVGGFFYAKQIGASGAQRLADNLPDRPEVHLLATTDLELGGAAQCQPIRSSTSQYRCRYTGLRLLVASNDRLFLVPALWGEAANSYVYVVPVTDAVRLDVRSR